MAILGKRAAMPEQNYQDQHEGQSAEHCANRDQYHRQHKRSSSLSLTVSHRAPLLSLLRGGHKKSSAGPTGFLQREYRSTPYVATLTARGYARVADNLGNARS